MNPLNLLTKGRTFRGGRDRGGTYKLPTGKTLPDFGLSKKDPTFSHPPQDVGAEPAPQPSTSALEAQAVPGPAQAEAVRPALCGPPLSEQKFFKRLTEYGRAFLRTRVLRRKEPLVAAPIQTELKLDNVTVVRNDLSEEDVEVVPAARRSRAKKIADKPASAPTPAPAPVPAKAEQESAVTPR